MYVASGGRRSIYMVAGGSFGPLSGVCMCVGAKGFGKTGLVDILEKGNVMIFKSDSHSQLVDIWLG